MAAGLGATVLCAGRREEQGHAVVDQIRRSGGKAEFVRTDIGDAASIAALFRRVRDHHGRLDGAFNNAAIEAPHHPFPDVPLELYDEVQAVNARGTFICLQHELRIMREQGKGAIVNTSSLGGVMGLPNAGPYIASKHAVVGMTRTAAIDAAAFGVRVNVICPGSIRTEMMQKWTRGSAEAEQKLASYAPLKRIAEPEEVANAALWLLSDAASYVTGLVMEIDGGVSIGVTT